MRSDLRDERGRDGISGWSSTGKGRTTCGYFLKDNKTVIYAEHARPRRGVPRPAGTGARVCVGRVSLAMDIYSVRMNGRS